MSDDEMLSAEDRRILSAIQRSAGRTSADGSVAAATARRDGLARRGRSSARSDQLEATYHQVRVLLLVAAFTADGGVMDGLTKLAKLDFLLRYPNFLDQLAQYDDIPGLVLPDPLRPSDNERRAVESRMIRYKYGPWDDKYYSIIGALVGRGLVEYVPNERRLIIHVTPGGKAMAQSIALDPAWQVTAGRSEVLRRAFAKTSGNRIKNLIYTKLPEVVDRPHRSLI